MLQPLWEEEIPEEGLEAYFGDLYRIVCVGERLGSAERRGALVRTTYLVDWEQLVHLLEDYGGFGEDIVEVTRLTGSEAELWRSQLDTVPVAHA